MKLLISMIVLASTAVIAGCTGSEASPHAGKHIPALENGAKFKEGQGLSFTDTMAQSIGLATAAVEEQNIHPLMSVELQSFADGFEASGWLNAEQASSIHQGILVQLVMPGDGKTVSATVAKLEKSDYAAGGDYEITVRSAEALKAGTLLKGNIRLDATADVVAIPKSALLSTAEGHFTYAKNGDFYVRTAVKVGASSADSVEVLDGLYAGDEIVTKPVMSLWLAELQILRGGKACTCGQ